MPRGIPNNRETLSQDLIDDAEDVLDFATLRLGAEPGAEIALIGEREFKDSIEYEKFMAEPLVVVVHKSGDKNAPTQVYCGVNGEGGWLPRGRKIRLKRSFVEVLARSQAISYSTRQNNDMNADDAMDTTRTRAQDYVFSVLHDPNPKGVPWLRRVSMQGR